MKALLVGKNTKDIEELVKRHGIPIVAGNPDIVISYGGDGTLLRAEREYPGIPKLSIRDSQFCKKCSEHEDEVLLRKLLEEKLQLKEYKKLETEIDGQTLSALNDFVIRNSDPTHTIRFKVTSPTSSLPLLIGDGVIIATPFGSTGYFKSISGQTFNEGFGLAFNNTTEKTDPLFLKDEDSLTFQLIRGKATLSFDNSPEIFTIDEGSELIFKLSNQVAKIYEDTSLRCPNCKVIRG